MATKRKKSKPKVRDLQRFFNSNPQLEPLTQYNHIRIQLSTGEEKSLLLTDKEVQRGLKRAENQDEEMPHVSWVRNLLEE